VLPTSAAVPGAPATLVERDSELETLARLVDAACAGHGGAARVLGPAGVGKTAMVRALVRHGRSRGAQVWLTSAGQLESRVPFGVVRRLLDRAVRELSQERRDVLEHGPARLALAHLWTGGLAGTSEAPAQGDMMHSLGWLLDEIVGAAPTLLVVDDAQWADEESLLFLGALRERLAELPMAAVISARDESVDRSPALAALVADRDAVVLRLVPLSGDGVDLVLGEKWSRIPAGTAAAVLEVTGGNPFLVHALADSLSSGSEPVDAAQVRAVVPDSVVDLMLARLSGLPAAEQTLARAVAVLDSAALPTAAALAGLEPTEAVRAADHLRRAGLFADDSELGFRHALLRTAVYAVIDPDTRDQLHRTAAQLLAEAPAPDRARAAAHLLSSSGRSDSWSVEVLRAAAAAAIGLGAPQSAVALLLRAVAEPPAEERRADTLFELGQAQLRTFDPGCITTLVQALSATSEPLVRAQRALVLASAYSYAGLHVEAVQLLDEALGAVLGHDRELELTLEAAWVAVALLLPDRVAQARGRLAELADLEGRTPAERLVLIQQVYVAVCTNQPASVVRALAARVIGDGSSAEQLPETGDWVWPRLFLGRIGDYDDVRRLTDLGLEHAESSGSVVGMISASFVRAFTEFDAGDLSAAEDHYRSMLDHHDGGLLIQMLGHSGLAQTLSRQGRQDEAAEVLVRFPGTLPAGTPSSGAALIWHARAVVARADGDHLAALDATDHLRDLLTGLGADSPTWVSWRPLAVEPLRLLGRTEEARAVAVEHLELCERSEVPHLIGEALCLLGTVTDPGEGIELARRGVALLVSGPSRFRTGWGSLVLGSLLRRSGSKAEARDHLRNAVAILTACGAAPTAEFAATELAATGVRLARADPRRLTPSEHRVAELAAAGLANREIAARLHVTRKTVETHLSAVYRKLDLTSREQLRPEHL
jgi:DNA-binding CsgD family transcriptional regulator/tetratricopeptide (TPR) repeat protein